MAIRIRTEHALIEVDSAQELPAVLDVLQNRNGHKAKPSTHPTIKASPHISGPAKYRQFYKSLETRQTKVIKAIRQKVQGITDDELCTVIDVQNKSVLAGIIGSIAKSAVRRGLAFEDILIKQTTIGQDRKKHHLYKLTDEMKEVVPE